jgi:hypothetical protein
MTIVLPGEYVQPCVPLPTRFLWMTLFRDLAGYYFFIFSFSAPGLPAVKISLPGHYLIWYWRLRVIVTM